MQLKIIAFLVLVPSLGLCSSENLDEMALRKSRLASSTWTKELLENPTTYVWQPETLQYTDITTGHEVWRLTNTKNSVNSLPDISWAQFSADGKRFEFGSSRDTSAGNCSLETDPNTTREGTAMIMRTDGSYLRPAAGGPFVVSYQSRYHHWSPVEPDVYYGFGRNSCGEGLAEDQLYKATVADTSISKQMVLNFATGTQLSLEKSFAGDGTKILVQDDANARYYPVTIYPSVSKDDADGWAKYRPLDSYWGSSPSTTSYTMHDAFLIGTGSNIKRYFLPEGTSDWWRESLSGAASDGGPLHTKDNVAPFSFGTIEPVFTGFGSGGSCGSSNRSPWNCDSDPSTGPEEYMSHTAFDRWGVYVAGHNSQQYQAWGVWNLNAHAWFNANIHTPTWGWHHDWSAWSDYFGASPSAADGASNYAVKYNGTDSIAVSNPHIREGGSTDYNTLPRATQSPDGTKLVYHSDFLSSVADRFDLFSAVAYYPHPPEIISVANNVDTYTVRFDWRTDQPTSRGYTQRGWPSEGVNDPPPPRETKLFRLWRSSTGTSNWTPVATVSSNIFSRYNFSTGAWIGAKYWEVTDTPGAGTYYYAVTSQEWSGLESRTLSNVFSTANVQSFAYPANPKAKSNFNTVYNSALVRFYNIYALDGANPSAVQNRRIASVPASASTGTAYIDWLGNIAGTTHYIVTAVDSQGNESAALTSTSSQRTPSTMIYDLSWTGSVAAGDYESPIVPTGSIGDASYGSFYLWK